MTNNILPTGDNSMTILRRSAVLAGFALLATASAFAQNAAE